MTRKLFMVCAILCAILTSSITADSAAASSVQANQCVTTNLRAWDMGGGVPWNRNYVIDVYRVTNPNGFFLYYDPLARSWMSIRWNANYLIYNNTGIRFGVSTAWAYIQPWWNVTSWRYVYPC